MSKNKVLIYAENIVRPGGTIEAGPFYVVVKKGRIHSIKTVADSSDECERCDAVSCHLLSPGFVDIHNHGLGGEEQDVLDFWLKPEYTCGKLVASGTTSILASIVFPPNTERMDKVLKVLQDNVGRKDIGAVIEGIHAEGPLLAHFDCLPETNKVWSKAEFENLLRRTLPNLKMMTLSPSKIKTLDYGAIEMLHSIGVVPSLGHDMQSTVEEIDKLVSTVPNQPCHVTNVFNAFSCDNITGIYYFGLFERLPVAPDYTYMKPVTVEVSGDMVDVNHWATRKFLSQRSWFNIAFITDCIADMANRDEKTHDNKGVVVKPCYGQPMVTSGITMLDIFRNLMKFPDITAAKAITMLSEVPARIADLPKVGTLEVGKDANFILFDQNYKLLKTFVDGKMVYRTSACGRKRIVSTESFDESFEGRKTRQCLKKDV